VNISASNDFGFENFSAQRRAVRPEIAFAFTEVILHWYEILIMFWTSLLAHGVLGEYDEIITLVVILIFFAVIGITWLRSRDNMEELTESQQTPPDKPSAESEDSPFTLD
jgi:hypothetical protein